VEWDDAGAMRKVRAEQLVYNQQTQHTIPEGPWVYTGSVFIEQGYAPTLADIDGTLIGFVHTPSPIIENPTAVMGPYGANQLNPALNLKPGTAITVTVRALPQGKQMTLVWRCTPAWADLKLSLRHEQVQPFRRGSLTGRLRAGAEPEHGSRPGIRSSIS